MRIMILLFMLFSFAVLPAYCETAKPKAYAEQLYRWVDDQGVEHTDVKSKVPAAMFRQSQHWFVRTCRGVRKFTMSWITPTLQTFGGARQAFNF